MTIIHQTDDYALVCKAAGEDSEHTLPRLLAEANKDHPEDYYIVHRLDKAAAGLLIVARNRKTAAELSRQVTEGVLRKRYLCVVPAAPCPPCGRMEDLLFRDRTKQKMFPVKRKRAGVKEAALTYTLLETAVSSANADDPEAMIAAVSSRNPEQEKPGCPEQAAPASSISLVEVELETGRFHQIRCQFASRRMPLLGDGKYGSQVHCALSLFCHTISFYDWKKKETLRFSAEPPTAYPWSCFPMLRESGEQRNKKEELK